MNEEQVLLNDIPENVFSNLDVLSTTYVKLPLVELKHRLCDGTKLLDNA